MSPGQRMKSIFEIMKELFLENTLFYVGVNIFLCTFYFIADEYTSNEEIYSERPFVYFSKRYKLIEVVFSIILLFAPFKYDYSIWYDLLVLFFSYVVYGFMFKYIGFQRTCIAFIVIAFLRLGYRYFLGISPTNGDWFFDTFLFFSVFLLATIPYFILLYFEWKYILFLLYYVMLICFIMSRLFDSDSFLAASFIGCVLSFFVIWGGLLIGEFLFRMIIRCFLKFHFADCIEKDKYRDALWNISTVESRSFEKLKDIFGFRYLIFTGNNDFVKYEKIKMKYCSHQRVDNKITPSEKKSDDKRIKEPAQLDVKKNIKNSNRKSVNSVRSDKKSDKRVNSDKRSIEDFLNDLSSK